jgi:hypothetical protein
MELIYRAVLLCVVVLAGALLLSPYEPFLEATIAITIVTAVAVGFLMFPRKEVFYVRTTAKSIVPSGHIAEHDYVAVKVELARLWLLFLPTFLAVALLVVPAAQGVLWKFSLTNWVFETGYGFIALQLWHVPALIVLVMLPAWITERWVLRDAAACSARSFSIYGRRVSFGGRVSYSFMGEHGEYLGGDDVYFGLVHPRELETIVFYNVRKPEWNKIAMGLLFHRLIILGCGVTDLDEQTVAAQTALAETTP